MKRFPLNARTAAFPLVASIAIVGFLFPVLSPPVDAASPSASARIIKKLKKQISSLKKQLAAATSTPAPFIEMVKGGECG